MHLSSLHAGCGQPLPQQHTRRLPARATGGERRSSSGSQSQHQRGRISSRSGPRPTGQAGFLSKVPEQQPTQQHESNASRTQQQLPQPAGIPAAVPAPPGADLYVPEPWEINEPWDVDETWEVPQGPDTSFQQEQRQQQEQNAPPPLDAAVGLQDPPGWLNQQDDAGGSFDQYDGSDEDDDDDDEDGWLLEEAEGLGESGVSSGRSRQQQQQQEVQDSWQDPSNASLAPLLSPKHQRQQPTLQQPQQQAPLPQQQLKQQQQVQPQGALPAAPVDLQATWDAALAVSLEVLTSYDVRYDVMRPARVSSSSSAVMGRPPGGSGSGSASGLGVQEEVSLTAAAAAAARMARRRGKRQALSQVATPPLLQDAQQDQHSTTHTAAGDTAAAAAAAGLQQQPHTLLSQLQQQQEQEPLPEDTRWLAVSRAHAAYLSYMQQLAAMVVSKQQQVHQLVYQVGISDSWLQLSHMLAVFGAREQLAPPVVAAMWKRLAAIINRKVFVRMSHAERCHYDAFIERLLQHTTRTLQQHTTTINNNSSSSSSASPARTGASKGSSTSSMVVLTTPVLPGHLAAIAYGMAVLGTRSEPLTAAVIEASARLLSAAAAGSSEAAGSSDTGSAPGPAAAASQGSGGSGLVDGSAAGGGVAVWGPGEVSSLLWGLGTVGATPPADWLQDVLTVSRELLPRCQPSQLWGVLWGASQCGALPGDSWLASWLAAAQQQLDGFNAEGLAHSIWALAALGHVPHKLWLRAYCGMVAYKIKSFVSGQLSMVLPALSTLGYKPRPELRRTFMAQVRRNLHTYSPSQLVSVLSALAAYPPEEGAPASTSGWHPGRLLLYDAITQTSQPGVMGAWSGRQAAQVLWAFSRFRYVPDRAYLRALLLHLQAQLPLCGPDALSMAVWALAALRQTLPSEEWGRDWCRAAQEVGGEFGPQALAHGLSGMAALRMNPPAELMQVLTRTASSCLPSFSCMELGLLIAALADLHWRPSDAWMTAFVSQVSQQLPAFQNEDYGLLLYGLASLAQPLAPTLLGRFCREAQRKLTGLSGEGLGLLMWGLAQYDYDMRGAQQWWADVFSQWRCKWSSTGLRGCGLMALGLAQLGPRHPPPGEWESGWVKRYKAVVTAKPRTWEELVVGFRAAAGLEPAEALPQSPWLCGLLLQLGAAWGLQELEGGAAAVAAVMQRVDVRVAAAAMLVDASGSGAGRAVLAGTARAAVGPLQLALDGSGAGDDPEEGYGDVEPTSATAVLL